MKKLLLVIICSLFSFFPPPTKALSENSRVMAFQGSGARTAIFLGMLQAFEEKGMPPDFIIGTCGGSVAAVIAHTIDDPEERMKLVTSRKFYELFKGFAVNENYDTLTKSLRLVAKLYRDYKRRGHIPDIWNEYLFSFPQDIPIDLPFEAFTNKRPRIVLIAGKAIYNKEEAYQLRVGRKLFQQVLFTDSTTAPLLRKFISPISEIAGSTVLDEVEVNTDVSLRDAMRASVADAFYLNPKEIDGEWYITGAIDLYPLELARTLGREVIMHKTSAFLWFEKPIFWASFNIDINKRRRKFITSEVDYMIDTVDTPRELVFLHRPNWLKWEVEFLLPEYEVYVQTVWKQFEYGYQQAMEAISSHKTGEVAPLLEL